MENNVYKGHIFTVTHHKFYDENYSPKTAKEFSYFKRSQWARCTGKNNILHYLGSHIDREQNNGELFNEKKVQNFSGFFTKDKLLNKQEKNALKKELEQTKATIYTAIFSFSNETNIKCKDSTMARNIIQNTFEDFLKKAKLNPDNVNWFGCIHTNTDHIHAHIVFFEKEPQYIDAKGCLNYKTTIHPKIPEDALSYYREKVGLYMINNEPKYQMRDFIINAFKTKTKELSNAEIIHKYRLKMSDFKVKQYNRLTKENKKIVDDCIDEIINSNPTLKQQQDEYENALQSAQEDLEMVADQNQIIKYKDRIKHYKQRRLDDLHNRFGNQILLLMIADEDIKKQKSNYKTEKASKTYYANSSKLIREKAIKSRNADYKYQRDVDKLIKIMSESDSWLFKYKDLADMVQGDE